MTNPLQIIGVLADTHPVDVEMIGMGLAILGVSPFACPGIQRWVERHQQGRARRDAKFDIAKAQVIADARRTGQEARS